MSSKQFPPKPKQRSGSISTVQKTSDRPQSSIPKKKTVWQAGKGGTSPPLVTGFGNAGAIFGKEDKEEVLHPHLIKMAQKSGQLNLSNRGMLKIPQKVFRLNEPDPDEKPTVNLSFDKDDEDRWWDRADLTRLYLSSNALTHLDPLIANLGALQLIDLTDNRLRSLPPELQELRALTKLLLSHNDLTELPEQLCLLSDLRILALDHNGLSTLPSDIGSLCILEQLDASHNCLTTLPTSIGYLQRLSKLNLADNKLTDLPIEIGDLFGLIHLDLTRNSLTSLPTSISNLPKLESLGLRQNSLSALPPLTNTALKELYLGANKIKMLDPARLEGLSGLHVLDLSDNGLDVLPDEITLLNLLQRLDLTNNYLSSLPHHLGLLPHLRAMPLDGNPLRLVRRDVVQRGTAQLLVYLASKITQPPNSYPGFADHVPTTCDTQEASIPDQYEMRNLRALVYNAGAAHVPDQLFTNGRLAQVRTADLSHNQLAQVPERVQDLSGHLCELLLNHNRLMSLPSGLGALSRLQFLDLQNNRLDALPPEIGRLPDLREVNIAYNRFERLPEAVTDAPSLEILIAADNKILEVDPERLACAARLATLDLTNNSIAHLPPRLGNMTQLMTLRLEGNSFRVPRHDILAKGTKVVLEYLRSRIVEK